MLDLLLYNCRPCAIGIRGGRIAVIAAERDAPATTVLDATGRRIATSPPATPGEKPVSPGRAAFDALFKKK